MSVQVLSNLLAQKEGQLQKIKSLNSEYRRKIKKYTQYLIDIEKAEELLKTVAVAKQEQSIKYIENIVTLAIDAVFSEDAIKFKIESTFERNKTGFKFHIIDKDKNVTDLKINEAGGLKDIVAFALRIACWSLQQNKTNIIILDEPFRSFNSNELIRAGQIIKELSLKLKIQFIIVTHKKALFDGFGIVYLVQKGKVKNI